MMAKGEPLKKDLVSRTNLALKFNWIVERKILGCCCAEEECRMRIDQFAGARACR